MISTISFAMILGLSAGIAPGPLLALVISETLAHDIKAGIKVAMAPFITDLPIIILSLLVLNKLKNFEQVLGVISFIGGCMVLYIGYEGLKFTGVQLDISKNANQPLIKGIMVNFASPHPYLFWITIGGPLMLKNLEHGILPACLFVVIFYVFLVGAKVILAILIGKSRSLLSQKAYVLAMRGLGSIMLFFSMILFKDGLRYFNLL